MTCLTPGASGADRSALPPVGILGGEGRFGRWMRRFFETAGAEVLVSDLGTPLSNEEVVTRSGIVIASLPIGETLPVLEGLRDYFRPDQLLCDLASVKSMLLPFYETVPCEVLSLHPMFAPSIADAAGQRVVACSVGPGSRSRAGGYGHLVERLFEDAGATVTRMTIERHDRLMAIVQGLNHFSAIALGMALERLDVRPEDLAHVASPIYRIRMDMVGRILGQDPRLYAEIATANPYVPDAIDAFTAAAGDLARSVGEGDAASFSERFSAAARHFGEESLREAAEESDLLVRLLAARKCPADRGRP